MTIEEQLEARLRQREAEIRADQERQQRLPVVFGTPAGEREYPRLMVGEYADYISICDMVPWATMNLLRRSRELKQFRHPRRQDKPAWRSSIRHDDYVAPLQYSPLTER